MRRAVAISLLLLTVLLLAVPQADADEGNRMLLDYGNGETVWLSAGDGTRLDSACAALEAAGIAFELSDGRFVSIGGMAVRSVGSQECSWRLYLWDGSAWIHSEGFSDSVIGPFAIAFYPDGTIVPAETPDEPEAWTSVRGDSASTGISGSYGTESPAVPIEWYRTYTTGYVDSSIISAGRLLYHTTGGDFYGTGTNKMPWVYCIDRYTGEEVWSYMFRLGQGYEVTSPLVVGDMLVVTATNWDVYLFDRYTGELYDTLVLEQKYPYKENGDVAWEGRTFFTGATTPVYDSGAIYFGIADGRIAAYGIETDTTGGKRTSQLVPLWEHTPSSETVDGKYAGTRGCYYYHAPVISDVDGRRVLFIGSYEGYVHALDASTGEEIWVQRMIDLGEGNSMVPNTPGSVASIAVTSGGRLLVTCTDGAMSPEYGSIMCVDASTGRGPDGTDCYWRYTLLAGAPVAVDGGFYCTASLSYRGDKELPTADGGTMEAVSGVYRFDEDGRVVWCTPASQTVKAFMTLADGVLYTNDYSAGTFYPQGGGVTAYSAEDGRQIWKIRLEPYSEGSYSMVAPTVIDGRIYVGNDYGAVYCISEVQGKAWGDEGELEVESAGFRDWSWAALVVVAILSIYLLYRFYRGWINGRGRKRGDRTDEERRPRTPQGHGVRGRSGFRRRRPQEEEVRRHRDVRRRDVGDSVPGVHIDIVGRSRHRMGGRVVHDIGHREGRPEP